MEKKSHFLGQLISLSLSYTIALFFFKSTRGNLLVKDIFNVVSHVHTKYDRVYNRKMSTQNGIVIWLGNRKWPQKKNGNGICLGNRKCCVESQNLKLLFNAPMFSFMYTINMKKLIIETTMNYDQQKVNKIKCCSD